MTMDDYTKRLILCFSEKLDHAKLGYISWDSFKLMAMVIKNKFLNKFSYRIEFLLSLHTLFIIVLFIREQHSSSAEEITTKRFIKDFWNKGNSFSNSIIVSNILFITFFIMYYSSQLWWDCLVRDVGADAEGRVIIFVLNQIIKIVRLFKLFW